MATSNLFCDICFHNVESTDDIVCLSCGHVFHDTCWNNWKTQSFTCPDCRYPQPNAQPIYLHINEPSKAKKELVQQLEESEENFLSALSNLQIKDDEIDHFNSEIELQNAKLASYEHELSEIKDTLIKSEKALVAAIKKKECEIDKLTSELEMQETKLLNCIKQFETILNDEDESDAKLQNEITFIQEKVEKLQQILCDLKIGNQSEDEVILFE